jgi:hypothetical protein
VKIKTLYTCCEQVGRRGKDYEKNDTAITTASVCILLRVIENIFKR